MLHYLLLKLKDDVDIDNFIKESRNRLERFLDSDILIDDVKIIRNAADRAENMDLLIILRMADAGVLPVYLESAEHKDFISFAGPMVASKITFDLEGSE
ncbi:MAG: Dabb family protein [Lachnospiraceae bacterium]|nr:Dabb family protein [Lachnospiraceae bacterium]